MTRWSDGWGLGDWVRDEQSTPSSTLDAQKASAHCHVAKVFVQKRSLLAPRGLETVSINLCSMIAPGGRVLIKIWPLLIYSIGLAKHEIDGV